MKRVQTLNVCEARKKGRKKQRKKMKNTQKYEKKKKRKVQGFAIEFDDNILIQLK